MTKQKVSFSGDAIFANSLQTMSSQLDRGISWPLSIGGGIAFAPIEGLWLTGDLQWTQWSGTQKCMVTDYTNPQLSQVTESMNWKNAFQPRVGCSYNFNEMFTLRGGYFYDPSPCPETTLNILFPSATSHVVTMGNEFNFGRTSFFASLDWSFGKTRNVSFSPQNAMPGKHDFNLKVLNFGMTYRFN